MGKVTYTSAAYAFSDCVTITGTGASAVTKEAFRASATRLLSLLGFQLVEWEALSMPQRRLELSPLREEKAGATDKLASIEVAVLEAERAQRQRAEAQRNRQAPAAGESPRRGARERKTSVWMRGNAGELLQSAVITTGQRLTSIARADPFCVQAVLQSCS